MLMPVGEKDKIRLHRLAAETAPEVLMFMPPIV